MSKDQIKYARILGIINACESIVSIASNENEKIDAVITAYERIIAITKEQD